MGAKVGTMGKVERWQTNGFGLYVHWPFCQSKCPYCDFNSHVSANIDQDIWRNAYLSELRRYAVETPGRVLNSIFFGGGTPSLMPPATVEAIIAEAGKLWQFANDIEITLEANPTSVEIDRLIAFRTAGVNRVSIGVQALNDLDLRRLGRTHGAAEARTAISVAQKVFDRTSFDLIYARQDQSLQSWERELNEALALSGDHLSLYQLTIEPGTVFGARFERGQLHGLPDENLGADMFEATQSACESAGRPAYEVSNHAKPGMESRHNTIYWRCGDYIGVGPGAHGRLTDAHDQRVSTVCVSQPSTWLETIRYGSSPEAERESLDKRAQGTELLVMGLRMTQGVRISEYKSLVGADLPRKRVERLLDLGAIKIMDDTLQTTFAGRLVLNEVIRQLID